jgi:hypothetical protein
MIVAPKDKIQSVNSRQEIIEAMEKQVLDKGNEWLREVIIQGGELIAIKHEVGHGNFTKLFDSQISVSYPTAARYMKVAANISHVRDLDGATSLRQALAICYQAGHGEAEPKQQWAAPVQAIFRLNRFNDYVLRHPINQWPQENIEELRTQLQPIVTQLWPDKF